MLNESLESIAASVGIPADIPIWVLIIGLVWSFVWKGIALWKAARKNSIGWFVALLIINTFGILEILYVFAFSKIKFDEKKTGKKKKKKR